MILKMIWTVSKDANMLFFSLGSFFDYTNKIGGRQNGTKENIWSHSRLKGENFKNLQSTKDSPLWSLYKKKFKRVSTCQTIKHVRDTLAIAYARISQVRESLKTNLYVNQYELFKMQPETIKYL